MISAMPMVNKKVLEDLRALKHEDLAMMKSFLALDKPEIQDLSAIVKSHPNQKENRP